MQAPESIHNRLLRTLRPATRERLFAEMQPVKLLRGQAIDHHDGHIHHMFFVDRGFISAVKTMADGRTVEVGGVGVEGVTDPESVLGGDRAVLDSLVQIPGEAFRIRRDSLRREAERDAQLTQLIQDYTRFLLGVVAQTAACNRLHSLEERCCRWLLIGNDNAGSDKFPLTHEFLAEMLGGTRASVSIAARMLKNAGLIDYVRGDVTILDREGLEEACCECYRATQAELDRLFGGTR